VKRRRIPELKRTDKQKTKAKAWARLKELRHICNTIGCDSCAIKQVRKLTYQNGDATMTTTEKIRRIETTQTDNYQMR